ncbi:MAG: hypothetical protein WCY41_02635 [Candidatus Micrarchaeia archaeon]
MANKFKATAVIASAVLVMAFAAPKMANASKAAFRLPVMNEDTIRTACQPGNGSKATPYADALKGFEARLAMAYKALGVEAPANSNTRETGISAKSEAQTALSEVKGKIGAIKSASDSAGIANFFGLLGEYGNVLGKDGINEAKAAFNAKMAELGAAPVKTNVAADSAQKPQEVPAAVTADSAPQTGAQAQRTEEVAAVQTGAQDGARAEIAAIRAELDSLNNGLKTASDSTFAIVENRIVTAEGKCAGSLEADAPLAEEFTELKSYYNAVRMSAKE